MTKPKITTEKDPTERLNINITSNARLECSRFCLTECGLYGEAQLMSGVGTVIATQMPEPIGVDFTDDNPEFRIKDGTSIQAPQIVMKCKGPRKKYWVGGELVCRNKASIDTE